MRIHTDGPWFKDDHGRTLILRGVNLGGSSKVPFTPDGATHNRIGFFDHRTASFVNRPFPLDEADEHLSRLRAWGLTTVRFLVTWEAIEHAGPGQYDQDYLEFVATLVIKAGEYGLRVFIDPHQDVWSRFSGGDGAPGWTFEAVGMDLTRLHATGAAIVHQLHGDPFPRMIWPSNSGKLAAATMFTLFFGGDTFAPGVTVDGEPVQGYLQRHYIGALVQVAKRLRDLPHVLGYDTMNEPLGGYIGVEDLHKPVGFIQLGASPSPFQSMLLGSGIPQEIEVWGLGITGARKLGSRMLHPPVEGLWLPGVECVWRRSGIWDLDQDGNPVLLRPQHFTEANGQPIEFEQDFYRPFANRVARSLREVHPDAMIFIESEPRRGAPRWGAGDAANIVYAPHWYDGFVLYMKRFNPWIAVDLRDGGIVVGKRRINRSFAEQLAMYKEEARTRLGGIPTLIGEFGIPFDLRGGAAYRSGDFRAQVAAMDRTFRAIETNLLSGTLWNYTADNNNVRGDKWNGEDLSIFSRDQQVDPHNLDSGGRALEAVVRPYPIAVAGEPLQLSFDLRRRVFQFVFRHDPEVTAPSEFFIPRLHYPQGYRVVVSDGKHTCFPESQTLRYEHDRSVQTHHILVRAPEQA